MRQLDVPRATEDNSESSMKNSVTAGAGAVMSSFPIHESFTVISGTCSSYPATLREARNRLILHWSALSDARGRIVDDDEAKE